MCLKIYKLQTALQLWFERVFSAWADIVSKRTLIVFIASSIILVALSIGNVFYKKFEDDIEIWTPSDNQTLKNKEKSEELFPNAEKVRKLNLIVESKGDNLITVDTFKEMEQFEQILYSITEYSDTKLDVFSDIDRQGSGEIFKFSDICEQIELSSSQGFQSEQGTTIKRCFNSQMPLDFVYNKASNSYLLGSEYDTDEKLLQKVQTGKGDPSIFEGNMFLYIEGIFAETEPSPVDQQIYANPANPFSIIGKNDVKSAKATQYTYYIDQGRNKEISDQAYRGFEENLLKAVEEWSVNTKAASFYLHTEHGYTSSYSKDFQSDLVLVYIAGSIVGIYMMLFLGSFSPMHCRVVVALAGITSVIMSLFAAFGLLSYCGQSTSNFHSWLPFLSMCIGVEHYFNICTAIDLSSLNNTSYLRIHEGLSHAGPSITITSLTTVIAFACGMLSSLEAIRSFCLFAGVCITVLYFTNMTLFLAVVVWDTRRVQNHQKECFGLCICKENSRWFCRGKCASKKQRDYVGNLQFAIADETSIRESQGSQEVETARRAIKMNSLSERCCGMIVAPYLLSTVGRIIVLVIYALLIVGAIIYSQELSVYFTERYFVSDSSQIMQWYEANDRYFKSGGDETITYVTNLSTDYSEIDIQNKIYRMNDAFSECKDCKQVWHQKQSSSNWFPLFTNWVSVGSCPFLTPALIPGQKIVVPQDAFYPCLESWFSTDIGRNAKGDIAFSEDGKIIGWRQKVTPIEIYSPYKDGPTYLSDIKMLEGKYGIDESFSFSVSMLVFEGFISIVRETAISSVSSIVAVFFVCVIITAGPIISALTVFSVIVVDLFLIALIPILGLEFNNVVVLHILASLGVSVLYSIQMTYQYLLIEAPLELTPRQQRVVKARVALSRVGASVGHTAFASLMAVLIIGLGQKSYFFKVFFRMWIGIVVSSIANTFVLLPVILSLIGPTPDIYYKQEKRKEDFKARRNTLSRSQVVALEHQFSFKMNNTESMKQIQSAMSEIVELENQVNQSYEQHPNDGTEREARVNMSERSPMKSVHSPESRLEVIKRDMKQSSTPRVKGENNLQGNIKSNFSPFIDQDSEEQQKIESPGVPVDFNLQDNIKSNFSPSIEQDSGEQQKMERTDVPAGFAPQEPLDYQLRKRRMTGKGKVKALDEDHTEVWQPKMQSLEDVVQQYYIENDETDQTQIYLKEDMSRKESNNARTVRKGREPRQSDAVVTQDISNDPYDQQMRIKKLQNDLHQISEDDPKSPLSEVVMQPLDVIDDWDDKSIVSSGDGNESERMDQNGEQFPVLPRVNIRGLVRGDTTEIIDATLIALGKKISVTDDLLPQAQGQSQIETPPEYDSQFDAIELKQERERTRFDAAESLKLDPEYVKSLLKD